MIKLILNTAITILLVGQIQISFGQTTIKMEKEGGVFMVPCTVNGLKLKFIFDTGASDVTISLAEAVFMLKNGYLKDYEIIGTSYSQIANGDITENTKIILREIEFAGLKIYNVEASVIHETTAPLLLGQTAMAKLGKFQFDPNTGILTIFNGSDNSVNYSSNNVYQQSKEKPSSTINIENTKSKTKDSSLRNKSKLSESEINMMVKEAYDRSLKDVDISHIMIQLDPNADEKDVAIAEQKIMNIQKKLKAGQSFEELAKQFSEDKNTKDNGGELGYFTALFPDGFYELESAAYTTKAGRVSGMVRTVVGLHLVKVNQIRDARGQIEVAHILVRNEPNSKDNSAAKVKIDSIYMLVKSGTLTFEGAAKKYSDDERTAQKDGYIGFVGIRQVSRDFEDAAFALEKDNTVSEPVESSIGWHIIKRISIKPIGSFDSMNESIRKQIHNDSRSYE